MPPMDPISRPSSTSTVNSSLHHSASLPQLPGLSALASLASGTSSPQLRMNKDNPFSKIFESILGFLEAFMDKGAIVSSN
ncbi:hypothetical protein BTUL_0063g00480 [Botrytis tulipae]|uniref:Uncharacterized protein n=1 Tax=Botrytis tulipae TaxID=87230 RepID=A0A4Z1EN72_9HELO|nr:hypothetical protein BTUL_0063g00480 [Botrytis tulipae]